MALPLYSHAGYFDILSRLPLADKINTTERVFIDKISKLDSVQVIKALSELASDARDNNDYALAALAYDCLGHYYMDKENLEAGAAYYEKGIDISRQNGEKIIEAKLTHDLGYQYFLKRNYSKAFENMLYGNDMMEVIGYSKYPNVSQYLYEIAFAYYNVGGYYEKSISYLKDALKYKTPNTIYDIWVNNTIALAYINQRKSDSALPYFNEALKYAKERRDTVWIGIIGGNIGNIYMHKKEYDKAIPLFYFDYEASMRYGEYSSASNDMLTFATISIGRGNMQLALKQLDTAKQLIERNKEHKNNYSWYTDYYSLLAEIYFKQHNLAGAYAALDSNYRAARHLWGNDNIKVLNQVETKIELEKHLAELKLVESERSRLLIRRNAIIVVLILLIVIVLQTLRRMRLKQKKDKEIYQLEAKRAEDEIQNARQLLASYTERLQKNSQLIQDFEAQMLELQQDEAKHLDEENDNETFDKLSTFTILKEEDWLEFKSLFSKVYPDFFRKLQEKHPDLTQSETRFLALLRLGLSIKEMGHTLGVSPNSVRKTRERLRKKITISEQEFLKEIFPES